MEIEFYWHGEKVGGSMVTPQLLEVGPVVVVRVPHLLPDEDLVKKAFRARAADGREFMLDVVKVKPDTSPGNGGEPTSTLSGYLRVTA